MPINQYLTGPTPEANAIPPELQQQIAASLRRRDGMGTIMALTGDRAAAPVGQQMMKDTGAEKQRLINQRYYQGLLENQQKALEERARATDLAYRGNMARTRAMLAKSKPMRPVPKTIQEELVNGRGILKGIDELARTFDPSMQSSFPGSGALRKTLGQSAPMLASADMKKYAEWRGNFERWYAAVKRHDLFGSALTATEAKNWVQQAVDPDASDEQVQRALHNIKRILEPAHEAYMRANARMYDPEVIADLGGWDMLPGIGEADDIGLDDIEVDSADDDLSYEVVDE